MRPHAPAWRNWVPLRSTLPCAVFYMTAWTVCHGDAQPIPNEISIPLTVKQLPHYDTYKASINIGFGRLAPLPIAFDTGSAGLHVFGAAKLDADGSGVQCTRKQIKFTVGNPGRVTYYGVMCHAPLSFGNFTTSVQVPFAYLTSATCAPHNPGCKVPDPNKVRGGVYGVFGAGITGAMPVENPILASSFSRYNIKLTRRSGELVLNGQEQPDAALFQLHPGTNGATWANAQTCLFVNGAVSGTCLAISFDTGNGVPWIRDSDTAPIPQENGLVTPKTLIGFGPEGATQAATSVVAGASFANKIRVEPTTGLPLTNTSIQAFFGHVVTYDNLNGRIYVAPISSQRAQAAGD